MFLQDWSSINSLLSGSRAHRLQSLQKLQELHEFVDFMSASDVNFLSSAPANRLTEKWSRRRPDDVSDSSAVWDDIVTNRCPLLLSSSFSELRHGVWIPQVSLRGAHV